MAQVCVCVSLNNHLDMWHAMSHAQSLLFPYLTPSAHSTRIPNPTSLLFPSHGDDHCDDPRHAATFGQLAETNVPTRNARSTGFEPDVIVPLSNTNFMSTADGDDEDLIGIVNSQSPSSLVPEDYGH